MIYGIGTDIVAVARLQAMWDRHGMRAAEKILAPVEIAALRASTVQGRFLAKRFVAKEAFAKAYGTGIRGAVTLPAVAVTHDEWGKPMLCFHGQLAENIQNQGLIAHLSLSDEADFALAYVILEKP